MPDQLAPKDTEASVWYWRKADSIASLDPTADAAAAVGGGDCHLFGLVGGFGLYVPGMTREELEDTRSRIYFFYQSHDFTQGWNPGLDAFEYAASVYAEAYNEVILSTRACSPWTRPRRLTGVWSWQSAARPVA
jgi:hypothetical protein